MRSTASAQQAEVLNVTREPGAEGCPDTNALLVRIAQLRGRPEAGATTHYDVRFTREDGGFAAAIRARGGAGGERVLRDRGQTCAALEQAAAVTIALLLDSDARASVRKPAPADAAPAPAAQIGAPGPADRPAAAPEPAAGGRVASPPRASLRLGAGALIGVVRPLAPALGAEAGIGLGRVRFGAGVLWVPAQALEHGPGEVRESLLGGKARACFAAAGGSIVRLDLCSGLYAGQLKVSARDFTRDDSAAKHWLALPLEIGLASDATPLGWELAAALLVPLRRHDFAVDGLGVVYESLPIAVLLSLRAVAEWPL